MSNRQEEVFRSEQEYYAELLRWVREELRGYLAGLPERKDGLIRKTGAMLASVDELEHLLREDEDGGQLLQRKKERRRYLMAIRQKGRNTIRAGRIIPMEYLLHAFGLNEFEAYMVILSWACEADPRIGTLLEAVNGRTGIRLPTTAFCLEAYSLTEEERMRLMKDCTGHWEQLSFAFDGIYEEIRKTVQTCAGGMLELGLKLDHRIVAYLYDYASEDPVLEEIAEYGYSDPGELLIHQETARQIARICESLERPGGVFISGERGAGKKYQVSCWCRTAHKELLLVDAKRLGARGDQLSKLLFRIMREALLRGKAAVCFYDIPGGSQEDAADQELMETLLGGMKEWNGTVFFTSEYEWNGKTAVFGRTVHKLQIPETTTEERIVLWENLLPEQDRPEGLNLEFLADKYRLPAGSIAGSARDFRNRARMEEGSPRTQWLLEACRGRIDHRLGGDAVRINAQYRWDDLILPETQKKLLRDACNQVMYHHQVYHKWGYEGKLAYGRGVSMLFYGPPGTGKTMGAQVIACELGLELYKVDMAGVMSKYVGESEKKLGNIFDQAKRSQSILFFDEADVLFGKRTDQKDSNDKYANASTAYLLQKIEEYEGIMILATNLLQNFDNAFLRRFKFLIEFPFTDQERRKEIWKNVFPAAAPVEELDVEYLAEEFKFSGSQIKNAAVAASFLAASEHVPVGMKHVLTAVKREMAKNGKMMIAKDFGPYYYLMEKEG